MGGKHEIERQGGPWGRGVKRGLFLAALVLLAMFLSSGAAYADPRICGSYGSKAPARVKAVAKGGDCVKKEKEAMKALRDRGLNVAPEIKEYCESVGTTLSGKSHVIMLECIEELEKRASGQSRGRGRRR